MVSQLESANLYRNVDSAVDHYFQNNLASKLPKEAFAASATGSVDVKKV
jgi:hypothetical protein